MNIQYEDFIKLATPIIKREAKRFYRRIQGVDQVDLEQEIKLRMWRQFDSIKTSTAPPHNIAARISQQTCLYIYARKPKDIGCFDMDKNYFGTTGTATVEVRGVEDGEHAPVHIDYSTVADIFFGTEIEIKQIMQRVIPELTDTAKAILSIRLDPPEQLLLRVRCGKLNKKQTQRDRSTVRLTNEAVSNYLGISGYTYAVAIEEIRKKIEQVRSL